MSAADPSSVSAPAGGRQPAGGLAQLRERGVLPELGVSAFLLVLGIVVLVGSTQIAADVSQRGPVGPKVVPVVVGVGLLIIALLHALDVARGGRGQSELGEDIDAGAPADWRTVGLVLVGFVGNILLLETLGWPLSGALMFFVIARALGSRTTLRDMGIALALSAFSFLIFAYGLGLPLPGGVLEPLLP